MAAAHCARKATPPGKALLRTPSPHNTVKGKRTVFPRFSPFPPASNHSSQVSGKAKRWSEKYSNKTQAYTTVTPCVIAPCAKVFPTRRWWRGFTEPVRAVRASSRRTIKCKWPSSKPQILCSWFPRTPTAQFACV